MELTAQAPGFAGARPLRVVRTTPRPATPQELWDRHGEPAYALACALIGDQAAAAEAVRLAMADLSRAEDVRTEDEARRFLAGAVLGHTPASKVTADPHRLPRPMVWLARLAGLQRTSLALCVYGGLTHREAAALLDVPPAAVAELITAGLRELNRLAATDAATCA